MQVLDACPLCRAALKPGNLRCPDCGNDLTAYSDLRELARRYLELAHEHVSRGEAAPARLLVERIPQVTPDARADLAVLRARIAILEGDFDRARAELPNCPASSATAISQEVQAAEQDRFQARELYNQALSAARDGAYHPAAQRLELAAGYDPDDPAIWALKLKVDLKCACYGRCYDDLAHLDRLAARPAEFHGLESLLPPV